MRHRSLHERTPRPPPSLANRWVYAYLSSTRDLDMPFDHFELLAPLYDRLIRPPEGDRLAELADLPISGRLLDAGGGTGRIAERLVDLAGLVVLADASRGMLREAGAKGNLCCRATALSEDLPFPPASFERVIVVDAYHHLRDQARSLQEFWRVLAPEGLLILEEPDIHRFGVKLIALAEKLALMRSHFVAAEKLAARLQDMGAQTRIYREGINAWVLAHKTAD